MDEYFVSHKAYKIDAKGRISIPANMRSALGNEFIASRGVGKSCSLPDGKVERLYGEYSRKSDAVRQKKAAVLFQRQRRKTYPGRTGKSAAERSVEKTSKFIWRDAGRNLRQ